MRSGAVWPARKTNGQRIVWQWPVWLSLLLALAMPACSFGSTVVEPAAIPASPTAVAPVETARATSVPPQPSSLATVAPGTAGVSPAPVLAQRTPTPRGPQVLTLAGGLEAPSTLDPALTRDASSAFLVRQIFSGLLRLDERLEPVPDLAAALPTISADRRTYSFVLRQDAAFHDGTPVTAETVKASFERAGDPALAGGKGLSLPAKTYLGDIQGMEARLKGERADVAGIRVTGPHTLEIELAAPQATFLIKLTHATASIVDVRETGQDDWWKRPNGSGPFQLTEWRDGDRLVFSRWQHYFGGAPPLEKIEWLLGANASQPLNLYEAGKIDMTTLGVESIDRALVPGSSLNRDLHITPQLSLTYIAFNVTEPPFDDVKVRQAFARVVNRDKVVRVMFDGKVQEAHGLVPPPLLTNDLQRPVSEQTAVQAEARQLLAESRYAANLPRPRFYVTGGAIGGMLREVYERELGITVDVITVPWNDYLLGLNERAYPAYLLTWVADYPDPQSFIETLFSGSSPENHANYVNPNLEVLLDQAAVEMDADRRAELYRRAQQIVLDDAVVLPLFFATDYTLIKPHVKGLTVTPMGLMGLERAWIER